MLDRDCIFAHVFAYLLVRLLALFACSCVCVHACVCLSVWFCVCSRVFLFLYFVARSFVYGFVCLCVVCLFVCLFRYSVVWLIACLSVSLFARVFVCLVVCSFGRSVACVLCLFT